MVRRESLFDSKKRQERRRRAAALRVALAVFVIIGGSLLLYSAPRYPQITISDINVSGNEVVTSEVIKNKVEDAISGNYLYVLPKKNIFLYPKDQISKDILEIDPHVLSANVSFASFHGVKISIAERKPDALYCGASYVSDIDIEASSTRQCYFLDDKGFIFATAPNFTGTVFVRYFGKLDNEEPIKSQFLKDVEYRTYDAFADRLKKDGYDVGSIALINEDETDVYLRGKGRLIVSPRQNLESAIDNFETLIKDEKFKGKDENGNLIFDYVDLRYGNKLFYKL